MRRRGISLNFLESASSILNIVELTVSTVIRIGRRSENISLEAMLKSLGIFLNKTPYPFLLLPEILLFRLISWLSVDISFPINKV